MPRKIPMTPEEFHTKFPDQDEINDTCLEDVVCPRCGSRGRFNITSVTVATVDDNGVDYHGDMEWEDNSSCACNSCGHGATVKDFTIEGLDEFLKSLEVKES